MEYRVIDRAHKNDIHLKNEAFPIYGRMIPGYADGKWSHTIRLCPQEQVRSMCFPDENYDYEALSGTHVFIGAYEGDQCVGLAVLADHWFQYMYLEDLKVTAGYRGRGVGLGLVEKALEEARKRGYRGLYTIGQDNNLGACGFYLKAGFEIGGFDNRVYRGTSQEDKADIYFYLDGQD